jgi:circadian clock protein KaiA
LYPSLSICIFVSQDALAQAIHQRLSDPGDKAASAYRYLVKPVSSLQEFYALVDREKQQLDCLILQNDADLPKLTQWLYGHAIVLPAVIIAPPSTVTDDTRVNPNERSLSSSFIYHTAEVPIAASDLPIVGQLVERAIAQFISLSPVCRVETFALATAANSNLTTQNFLPSNQRRLTEKLTERLGYLSVYYKRNPQNFLRNLPTTQRQEIISRFKSDYRDIVLCYFANDDTLNQRIDNFVDAAFFTDVAVSQIVEIHMELMDDFSKQLKLEGRSEDILLDYRLTLIDLIAHLCEMYRRSMPKEG